MNTPHSQSQALEIADLPREKIELLKRTIARGTTDDEFQLFLHICKTRRVDPFGKLIYPVKRYDSKLRQEVMQLQSSIDSFRLQAERTGKYAGQLGPEWCGEDGRWRDVWLMAEPPRAARVGVLRVDFKEPLWTVALWDNYVQLTRDGSVTSFWSRMGPLMLAKCAEALSLRRAFPEDLAGLYTPDEMAQADNPEPSPAPQLPAAAPASAAQEKGKALDRLAKAPPATQPSAPAVKSKRWVASPEWTLDVDIPVSLPMWNLWADEKIPPGVFTDKGHATWRVASRGSLEGYRCAMLNMAVTAALAKPDHADSYHEKCAATLAVLRHLNQRPDAKRVTTEPDPVAEPEPAGGLYR